MNFEKNTDSVKYCINKLIGKSNISSIKGKIGEDYIENTLKNNFPDNSIYIQSKKPHESDIHMINNSTDQKILIESKLYKNIVSNIESSKEILKEEKDEEMREMAKIELDGLLPRKEEMDEEI